MQSLSKERLMESSRFDQLNMTAAPNKKYRILRAIEGEGEDQKTEDFVV